MKNDVTLVGHYGGDISHAQSAWTSTDRTLSEERKNRMPAMLKFLAENNHHTPFEKSYLHFVVVCDTASHIHFLKHRIGVSVNAESARYKELQDDKYYVPDDWPQWLQESIEEDIKNTYNVYHTLIDHLEKEGIDRKRAKESARFILPYANQLTLDVGFNFRSFMHFQGLRNKPDAQREIREIAEEMLKLVKETGEFDHSIEAFKFIFD